MLTKQKIHKFKSIQCLQIKIQYSKNIISYQYDRHTKYKLYKYHSKIVRELNEGK